MFSSRHYSVVLKQPSVPARQWRCGQRGRHLCSRSGWHSGGGRGLPPALLHRRTCGRPGAGPGGVSRSTTCTVIKLTRQAAQLECPGRGCYPGPVVKPPRGELAWCSGRSMHFGLAGAEALLDRVRRRSKCTSRTSCDLWIPNRQYRVDPPQAMSPARYCPLVLSGAPGAECRVR